MTVHPFTETELSANAMHDTVHCYAVNVSSEIARAQTRTVQYAVYIT